MNQLPDYMVSYLKDQLKDDKTLFQILDGADRNQKKWLEKDQHLEDFVSAYNKAKEQDQDIVLIKYYDEGPPLFEFDFKGKDELAADFLKQVQNNIDDNYDYYSEKYRKELLQHLEARDLNLLRLYDVESSYNMTLFFQKKQKQIYLKSMDSIKHELGRLDDNIHIYQTHLAKLKNGSHKVLQHDYVISDFKNLWLKDKGYDLVQTERITFTHSPTEIIETWIKR